MDKNVSIIMLTYNRARYIGPAIQSIFDQTYENWELIIIDDGSTDKTEDIISPFLKDSRIQYIKKGDHEGIAKNRNLGVEMAKGEYIAVLDSDDVWIDKEKLLKQLEFFQKNPNHVLLGTNFEKIDQNGRIIRKMTMTQNDAEIRRQILLQNVFAHSSVMFKKTAPPKVGAVYDESLPIWEDYDLWLRLGKAGKIANLPDNTIAYRVHPGNVSAKKRIKGALVVLKIISRYKKDYPNFFKAYLKGLLRIVFRSLKSS